MSFATVGSAQEVVALYTFPAAGNYSSSASSSLAAASVIENAAGGSITSTGLHYFRTNEGNAIPDSFGAALTNNNYIGFTITPAESTILSFETLSFSFGSSNATSGLDYTVYWAVFAQVGGFSAGTPDESAAIQTGSFYIPRQSGNGAAWVDPSPSIALGSAGLANAALPTEFRIYFWDSTATSHSSLTARFDNIQLTASAIPEPSTYAAMFGLVALGLVCRRRRSKR